VILRHVFGRPAGRRTLDIDFGIAVRDWKQFENLKKRAGRAGGFPLPCSCASTADLPFGPRRRDRSHPVRRRGTFGSDDCLTAGRRHCDAGGRVQ
jgi:hypothetical protein